MKFSDFFKIPMKHIIFENSIYDINKEWSYGQEWTDFPHAKVKGISITVPENKYTLKSTDCRMLLPVRKKIYLRIFCFSLELRRAAKLIVLFIIFIVFEETPVV